MALPRNLTWDLAQYRWASQLDPVLAQPQNQGLLIRKVGLINGHTVINHMLDRKLQGWILVRQRAQASIYDAQDSNQTPQQTLILISDQAVVVDVWVF